MGVSDIQSGSVYKVTNAKETSLVLDLSGENERQGASYQKTTSWSSDNLDYSHRIF